MNEDSRVELKSCVLNQIRTTVAGLTLVSQFRLTVVSACSTAIQRLPEMLLLKVFFLSLEG